MIECQIVGKYEVQTDMSADMSVRGTRWQVEVSVRGTRYCSRWRLANQRYMASGVCQSEEVCVRYKVSVFGSVPIIGNNVAVGEEQKDQNTLRSSNM
ncbi:hypothetical protein Tco_1472269, partial [Tanacetum coccineum]